MGLIRCLGDFSTSLLNIGRPVPKPLHRKRIAQRKLVALPPPRTPAIITEEQRQLLSLLRQVGKPATIMHVLRHAGVDWELKRDTHLLILTEFCELQKKRLVTSLPDRTGNLWWTPVKGV